MKQNVLSVVKTYAFGVSIMFAYMIVSIIFSAVFLNNPYLASGFARTTMIIICVFLYKRVISKRLSDSSLSTCIPFSWSNFAVAVSFWVMCCFMFITIALYIESLFFDPEMEARTKYFDELTTISPFLQIIFSCVIAPITEELMCRLCIYNIFKSKSPWFVSMIVSAFIFAAMHGTITHMVYATLFGCILVLIYENTGRHIVVTMFCHCIYNSIVMFSGDGSDYPYDNPYLSIGYIILLVVIIVCVSIKINSKLQNRLSDT